MLQQGYTAGVMKERKKDCSLKAWVWIVLMKRARTDERAWRHANSRARKQEWQALGSCAGASCTIKRKVADAMAEN